MAQANPNSKPRALILAPLFSTEMNANRPLSVAIVLSRMASVDVVTTDFDHWTKKEKVRKQVKPIHNIIYLKTMPYASNVSAVRLLSHLWFSLRAALFFLLHRNRYDIVYATAPFNTLAWLVFQMAGSRPKIVDVTDIWPDVLPFSPEKARKLSPLFKVWRGLFDGAVAKADIMMAVSDSFFHEAAKCVHADCKSRRFYLGEVALKRDVPKNDVLTVAYSGNIGRLYDFETLIEAMASTGYGPVQLYIIGEGDRREWLLSELQRLGLRYTYFGSVYDSDRLGEILSSAHIGFNGFINTSASFSTKAVTYFAAGLPILNSMSGDLENLVTARELGFNYRTGQREDLRLCFTRMSPARLTAMSDNCIRFFSEQLDRTRVRDQMEQFLRESVFERLGEPETQESRHTGTALAQAKSHDASHSSPADFLVDGRDS